MKNVGSSIAAFVICTLIGVFLIRIAISHFKTGRQQKERCKRTAKGFVTDVKTDRDIDNGHISYYHIYSYTVDGETYTIRSKRGTRKYDPERVVTVFYDPRDPQFAYVEGQDGNKIGKVCLAAAFLFFAVAMYLFVMFFV